MSGLTFRLKLPASERIDCSELTPSKLLPLSHWEISRLNAGFGKNGITAGDAFEISGSADTTITFEDAGEGTGASLDFIGKDLDSGTIIVTGNAGVHVGRNMRGGDIKIRGNAGNSIATGMTGGLIHIAGNASDNVGGVLSGDRFGMQGGIVVIEGNSGARTGDKMRRGTIIVRGKTGDGAGTRMMGGTIWAEGGFGPAPGLMMRRGTLVGPSVERLLPTFADGGKHDLVITRIMNRHFKTVLGGLAPKPIPLFVRKISGDLATIGKGEILLTG